mgnify:CR=1 FL=1
MIDSKIKFTYAPIGSIKTLAELLGFSEKQLIHIANTANQQYFDFIITNNNKTRNISEPTFVLKKIQKRINSRIFSGIVFPNYLQGGIKATENNPRDYIENAKKHCDAQTLINVDIQDFYPSIHKEKVKSIYRHLLKYPTDVIDILTKLTMYNDVLPQGGCTSSYLANLVLFNHEYKLVDYLSKKQIKYTRLIDDMTISCSVKRLTSKECEDVITRIAAMLKLHDLSIKNKKTLISHDYEPFKSLKVTGLHVKHKVPKVPGKDRKYIRQLVYICEKNNDRSTDEYHTLWNKASGKIAKINRLNYPQAITLRERMSKVLPIFDDYQKNKLISNVNQLLSLNKDQKQHYKTIRRINDLYFKLNILGRSHPRLSSHLRKKISQHFGKIQTNNERWN